MDTKNPPLDMHGRQVFSMGGHFAWKTHDCGDYQVSMEWVDGEPAMVIWSTAGGPTTGAMAICLSSAGKYATPEGRANQEGLNELAEALPHFGRPINRGELHHLADIVLRYIPELILMPPAPRSVLLDDKKAPMLEVTRIHDQSGKVVSEASI